MMLQNSEASKLLSPDLDIGLLLRIMERVKSSDKGHAIFWPSTGQFLDLVTSDKQTAVRALNDLNRHVDFLLDVGLLSARPAGIYRGLRLTAKGRIFVQPELAEFGEKAILPQVVSSLEAQIHGLTYPQTEKDGMLFKLREAVAKQMPDVIAKVIVEIGSRVLGGK